MTNLINSIEGNNKNDIIQVIIDQLITHQFFLWTCLIVILSRNWKKPIVLLMILHWGLRTVGDMFVNTLDLYEKEFPDYWPYSNNGFMNSYGIASFFWYSSEIVGDWYLFLRTRVIIKDKKKTRWVFITLLLYNAIKIYQMFGYPLYVPFTGKTKEENYNEQNYIITKNKAQYNYNKWIGVSLQQIGSLLYDIAVLMALRKNLFKEIDLLNNNNLNNFYKENTFLKRFKKVSEYRIYLSIFVTIIGSPFIFGYCLEMIYLVKKSYTLKHTEMQDFINNNCDDRKIDSIRVLILNFSFTFMYIDQILLKHYAEENEVTKKSTSSDKNSDYYNNNNVSPTKSFNFNMVYHDFKNYDEFEDKRKDISDSLSRKNYQFSNQFNNNSISRPKYSNNLQNNNNIFFSSLSRNGIYRKKIMVK
ncbi:hypothetical protein BCR32DRAFT_267170 [Anaeromyces robustus]|uniref:Uncharacterized protein n=1 Tax=Anaeromyces robustus TaxID=1754192 RepID=A0A1Y1XCP0_9FUNG|nr:hypothetical protein BCR32DRAFT_267170 [Anaeromyces robustus]|eukprot:ORX83134.1 hypothetical protein BCR32DRAFT_267170 [Anaeromyces robustus]